MTEEVIEETEVTEVVEKKDGFIAKAKKIGSSAVSIVLGAAVLGGFYTLVYGFTKVGTMAVDATIDAIAGSTDSSNNEETGNVTDNTDVPIE